MDTENKIPKLFKNFIFWGAFMIASTFVGGIGDDLRGLLLSTLTESSTIANPITWEQIFRYIAPFMGVVILSYGIYKSRKNKDKQTAEEKLDELIQELQSFNKKWNKGILLIRFSYRTQILRRTIWDQNPEKIRILSIKIKRKNAILKELKIKNSSNVTNSVTNISDRIAELGLEIEDVFLTKRQEEEAEKKDPSVFENFVKVGDDIHHEIISVLKELEKLRTHVL